MATKKAGGLVEKAKKAVKETVEKAEAKVAERVVKAEKAVEKAAHAVGVDVNLPKPRTGERAAATPSIPPTAHAKTHSFRRKLIGRVTSDKMDKTVVVEVSRYSLDRVYKKYVKERTKYKAHDENNEYKTGDRVEIMEHRPLSKEKRWKVVRLVSRPVLEERI